MSLAAKIVNTVYALRGREFRRDPTTVQRITLADLYRANPRLGYPASVNDASKSCHGFAPEIEKSFTVFVPRIASFRVARVLGVLGTSGSSLFLLRLSRRR